MRIAFLTTLLLLPCMLALASGPGKKIVRAGPKLDLPFSPAVEADGLIYVAGAIATDPAAGKLAGGDIRAQTRRTLDNLASVVTAAGSTMANVASVTVYLKNPADFPAMNEVYRTYWPKDPPARTTVVANLAFPEALIEIAMVAIPNGRERRVIHPADWIRSPNPYSYGIKSGDTLFLSGMIARHGRDNSVVAGDMTTQTRVVLDNAGEVLRAAGMSHADVVSSRVFVTDAAKFQEMNAAYRAYFPHDPPARATVKAGLMGPQYVVEITLVAVQGRARQAVTAPNADGTPGALNPNLSSAIRAGKRLYVSGMLGNTPANLGDTRAQTRETLVRIGRTLRAAGFDWGDVVDGVVYLTDIRNFPAMNEAYREVFKRDFPARATVETALMGPEGLVEIMFVAVK
jgi:2-iminobutanoate/2-iminopropanoate deaminase